MKIITICVLIVYSPKTKILTRVNPILVQFFKTKVEIDM